MKKLFKLAQSNLIRKADFIIGVVLCLGGAYLLLSSSDGIALPVALVVMGIASLYFAKNPVKIGK